MNIPNGSDIAHAFITNVGLVTTEGIFGNNIMACEWTFHVSYNPALISICVNPRHATYQNLKNTKEFGLGIASTQQMAASSVAGRESGRHYDKIKILSELGFQFKQAKIIKTLMLMDTVVNFECIVLHEILLGDHTMFVGEVVEAEWNSAKKPLAYHQGKYWEMTTNLEKPTNEHREKIKIFFDKNKK